MIITGKEIADRVKLMISYRMQKILANDLFRSRTDILAAIKKLEKDNIDLQIELNQNNQALEFLNRFKHR